MSDTISFKQPCGCKLRFTTYALALPEGEIEYCPEHAAAPELVEALKTSLRTLDIVWRALDGIYGANAGEDIPFDSLTPDRQAAFDSLLNTLPDTGEAITAALAKARGEENDNG